MEWDGGFVGCDLGLVRCARARACGCACACAVLWLGRLAWLGVLVLCCAVCLGRDPGGQALGMDGLMDG